MRFSVPERHCPFQAMPTRSSSRSVRLEREELLPCVQFIIIKL